RRLLWGEFVGAITNRNRDHRPSPTLHRAPVDAPGLIVGRLPNQVSSRRRWQMQMRTYLSGFALVVAAVLAGETHAADEFFKIQVIDEETERGVPLVELETVNNVRYVTDSNGLIALNEPGLFGQRVFFFVRSHGYEFAEDGFGYRGQALEVR